MLEALTACETKNRYHITPIPAGAIPDPARGTLPESWLQHFRAQNEFAPLLKAKEESECCQRQCCTPIRKFGVALKDGAGQTFFSSPSAVQVLHPVPLLPGLPRAPLYDEEQSPRRARRRNSSAAGRARDPHSAPRRSMRRKHATLCSLFHSPASCTARAGNNCFAPSCCNRDYDMDVMDASESVVVGHVANVFPGCNCGGITERSNFAFGSRQTRRDTTSARSSTSTSSWSLRLRDAQARTKNETSEGFVATW